MQHKKQFILEQAMDLFLEKGYMKTSMQDIAEQCNVSKSTLYKLFDGKEEIALMSIFYKTEQMLGMVEDIMDSEELGSRDILRKSIIIRMKEFSVRNQFMSELASVFTAEQWRRYLPKTNKIKYATFEKFSKIIMKSFHITDEALAAELTIQLNGLIREMTDIAKSQELVVNEQDTADYIVDVLEAVMEKRKGKKPLFATEQLWQMKSAMGKSDEQVRIIFYKKKLIQMMNRAMDDYEKKGQTERLYEVQHALNELKELEQQEREEI